MLAGVSVIVGRTFAGCACVAVCFRACAVVCLCVRESTVVLFRPNVQSSCLEKILGIYVSGDPKLNDIKWKEPIDLDHEAFADSSMNNENEMGGESGEEYLPINTFSVDGALVVTTPDVNRIVDYLGEQSASLDYHFRKLGIQKMRFSYSQLHQLRRMQVFTFLTLISAAN